MNGRSRRKRIGAEKREAARRSGEVIQMADILHKAKDGWCCPKIEERCAECGKKFKRTDAHVFMRRNSSDARIFYCSYTCFRVQARQEEAARLKEPRQEDWEEPELSETEKAERRVALCREKIGEFTAKRAHAATRIDRNNAKSNVNRWKKLLKKAEAALEELKGGQA